MNNSQSSLLHCENLSKLYGDQKAIDNISIKIESTSLGLLGPNGSGKTTLIKLMLGLIYPSEGSINLKYDIDDMRVIPDYPALPREFSINQWLKSLEDMHGPNHLELDIQSIFQLRGDWKIKNLSAGQMRKAALLPAFYGKPKLFILDEPTNFLDIVAREQVLQLLWEYIANSKADLILATHRIDEMRLFSKKVILLKEGKVVDLVSNDKQAPKSYTLQVDNMDMFKSILNEEGVDYTTNKRFYGDAFTVVASVSFWAAIERFRKQDGNIFSFNSNDMLKTAVEELII